MIRYCIKISVFRFSKIIEALALLGHISEDKGQ